MEKRVKPQRRSRPSGVGVMRIEQDTIRLDSDIRRELVGLVGADGMLNLLDTRNNRNVRFSVSQILELLDQLGYQPRFTCCDCRRI